MTDASFLVVDSGSKYKNGRLAAQLSTDRVTVNSLHIEDVNGHPLDVQGSLGTHELRVANLEIEMVARRFEVMRNEFGRVDVDANLRVTGQFERPVLTGDLTIAQGDVKVDEIFLRALVQPYEASGFRRLAGAH